MTHSCAFLDLADTRDHLFISVRYFACLLQKITSLRRLMCDRSGYSRARVNRIWPPYKVSLRRRESAIHAKMSPLWLFNHYCKSSLDRSSRKLLPPWHCRCRPLSSRMQRTPSRGKSVEGSRSLCRAIFAIILSFPVTKGNIRHTLTPVFFLLVARQARCICIHKISVALLHHRHKNARSYIN